MPTREEIDAEIKTLKGYLTRVLSHSAFGDCHTDAVEAQIEVLERRLVEDDIEEEYADVASNVRENAEYAARWLEDDVEDGKPSEGWVNLLDKEPVKILPVPQLSRSSLGLPPREDLEPGFCVSSEPVKETPSVKTVTSPTATKTRKINARLPKNNKKTRRKKASR